MPLTPAHAAAVVPLWRLLGSRAVLSALVIGSMTPDFAYFLPLGVRRAESHSLAGLALATLALVHATVTGAVLLAATGVLAGIAQIAIVSWIQRRVAPEMMGRAMSVLMFTFMGLGPISAAIAGSLLRLIPLTGLFAGAGLLLTAIALGCMRSPALRSIGAAPAATAAS